MNSQICLFDKSGKLLLATDGSKLSDGAIREALSISRRCSSMLIAVSVIKMNLEFEMTMPQVIEQEEEEAAKHFASMKEEKSMQDLIIVGSHGRTGIQRLRMGSVTERVIGHSETAVLVVKAK